MGIKNRAKFGSKLDFTLITQTNVWKTRATSGEPCIISNLLLCLSYEWRTLLECYIVAVKVPTISSNKCSICILRDNIEFQLCYEAYMVSINLKS